MHEGRPLAPGPPGAVHYVIRVKGRLHDRWATWFDDLHLVAEADGTTVISGLVVDQAALQGLLQRVHDLGLELVSVSQLPKT